VNRSRRMTTVAASAVALLAFAAGAGAQTTQPSAVPAGGSADAALELRATQSFNKGDYAVALPMLHKLAIIQEQMRVCQRNQPSATPAAAASTVAAPSAGAPTAGDRKPHPAPRPGEVLDLSIKDLGNFEYDPDQNTPIPADVKALSGATVRLHGFMIPMDQAENISKFALVPSLFNCCMGQPPQVQHTIVVTCPKGKAVSYYPDEIVVEGKLTVDVMKDDGFIVGIFAVDTTSVKPAAK
jgi:hypothetical protein